MTEIVVVAPHRQNLLAIAALAHRFARHACTPAFALFIGGYLALIAWFAWVALDPSPVAAPGIFWAAHQVFRVLFTVYLFALVYGAGAPVLRVVAGRTREGVSVLDHLALSFFTGAGLWHLAMLVLGAVKLEGLVVMVAVTLPPLALAHPMLEAALARVRSANPSLGGQAAGRRMAVVAALAALAIVVLAGIVLPAEGMPPKDIPSEVGLFRLATLLGGPSAPHLVTFWFIAMGAVALFQFVRRFMAGTPWPWVAVIVFLALLVHAPGADPALQSGEGGGTAAFRALNAALVIAILWMTAGAIERRSRLSLAWTAAAAAAVIAAATIDTVVAVYLGAVFVNLALWFLAWRDGRPALACLALFGVTAAVLATGWVTGNGLRFGPGGDTPLATFDALVLVFRSLRLDVLYPLVGGGLAVVLAAAALRAFYRFVRHRHRSGTTAPYHAAVMWVALVIFVAAVLLGGGTHTIAAGRYASIGMPAMIAAGIWLWAAPFEPLFPWLRDLTRWWPVPAAVLAACLAAAWAA